MKEVSGEERTGEAGAGPPQSVPGTFVEVLRATPRGRTGELHGNSHAQEEDELWG